ncbi:MAG: PEP/pyruvate-binding domain-containing protein [Bdellovibrionota bacterium]
MTKKIKFSLVSILVLAAFISSCALSSKIGDRYIANDQSLADKHLRTAFANYEEILEFAQASDDEAQIKFVMLDFQKSTGTDFFLDPKFYRFHDEWFLMRTFNGQDFPWLNHPGFGNLQALSPQLLQKELLKLPQLPDGIIKVSDRAVADVFYKASSGANRKFALGSIIYSFKKNRPMPRITAFDMVFNDEPTEKDFARMYTRLQNSLQISNLKWLPRSQAQEALATQLKANPQWKDRIISYDDLIVPGEIKTYSEQTVAGIPIYFPKGSYDPSLLSQDNIVILDELPDDLPAVRGIVTSVPQTELSHVNILARARGTLNVHLADTKMLEELKEIALTKKPVALWALKNQLKIKKISDSEYKEYQSFFIADKISLEPIDTLNLNYIYDLKEFKNLNSEQIVRAVGGKSLGMHRLLNTADINTPIKPFSVSVRAYREHLQATFQDTLKSVFSDSRFKNNSKIRYLTLEGAKKFKELYPQESQKAPYVDLIAGADSTNLGKIIARKGLKEAIEKQEIDPKLESLIVQEIKSRFTSIPLGQAFRFRSSADVEDIPGFVGAGLYDSYSGFLDPKTQALNEDDKKKTISRAIKKTWASYWNYRAYEERELSGIDHLSGSMAVMVHPNFPEITEKANGVLTIHWKRQSFSKFYNIHMNTNIGEEAVVRPDGSIASPQMIEMTLYGNGEFNITKYQSNSDGVQVLSKEQAETLAKAAAKIFERWLEQVNKNLKPEHQNTQYTLDMEYKIVPENWLKNLDPTGNDVFVIKQSRPLIRSQKISPELAALPIPRSLLSEATKIIRRKVDTDLFKFSTIEVYDAQTPYDGAMNVQVDFEWLQNVGNFAVGTKTQLLHTDFAHSNHGFMHHGPWDFSFETTLEGKKKGISAFNIYNGGSYSINLVGQDSIYGNGSRVETEFLFEAPSLWLSRLMCKPKSIDLDKFKPAINIGIDIGTGLKPDHPKVDIFNCAGL